MYGEDLVLHSEGGVSEHGGEECLQDWSELPTKSEWVAETVAKKERLNS